MSSVFRGQLLKSLVVFGSQYRRLSTKQGCPRAKTILLSTLGVIGAGAGALLYALENAYVEASYADLAHAHHQPWTHDGWTKSLDHASIRRGYEVYKQICKACHSCQYIAFRNLVGVSHTEEQAKAEAAEVMVRDGPDETGEFFERPGRLSDYFPSPYPNENAARYANNGSYPPDLSLIVLGRHGGEDYVFSLLTGYVPAPAGVALRDGQHYNPYFMGGAIAMGQLLTDDAIEYSDGTCATAAQMAKDVATFLRWTSEPELDQRRLMSIRLCLWFTMATALMWFMNRHKWISMKSRKLAYKPVSK
ncbi:uncharacterized protein LOC133533106 [Cydia pomonella]|uniref:uncharacterized protein LOC133533106 n=1 Tax=Cydia pomonella TaxID=82600 RepID=UPI002ADD9C42|nr:uncharacterized protein LOC133533106 [Cydia pomonella]